MAGSIPTVGLHRTRTRFSSSTTNGCSNTIDSHCQIQQRPKLLQSKASLQTPAWAFLPHAPPSCGWPLSVSDIFLFALSLQIRSSQRSLQCGRGFHRSAPKAVSFKGLSMRLFECDHRQRLSVAARLFVQPSVMVKETLETLGQTQPRALLISVSNLPPRIH